MQSLSFKKYQFPIRHENHFELLVDGDLYFARMLAAIANARHFIFLEQYLVASGRIADQFIEQLALAAQRGVDVYLLLDDFGSSKLSSRDRHRIERSGIKLCLFNRVRFKYFFSSLFRDHRKSLIIDGELIFTGGAGLTDEFSPQFTGKHFWHDIMLAIRGPVLQDWCELFADTWQHHSKEVLKVSAPTTFQTAGNGTGRVLVSKPLLRHDINRALIKHLRRSQDRAWICSPYFVASRKIRRVLCHTARRGIDVRLLLPGKWSDHPWISFAVRRHYTRLLKNGVRIFEYQPRFNHAKINLVDNWVSIGSSNLDRWNQRWNLDANQSAYDPEFAAKVAELFASDFSDSQEIQLTIWRQRPWLARFRETISARLVNWLEHWLHNRKN